MAEVEHHHGNGGNESDAEDAAWWQVLIAVALVVGVGVAVYLFFRWLEPDRVPEQANPDFVDTIFASGFVIAAARVVLLSAAVVLLFGALYIALSVIVRMQRGQWLRRAGPFESHIEEAQEELDEVDPLLELVGQLAEENEMLATRLEQRDTELAEALNLIEERDQRE